MRQAAIELLEAEKQTNRIDLKNLTAKTKVALQLEKLELRKLRNRIKAANAEILKQVEEAEKGLLAIELESGKETLIMPDSELERKSSQSRDSISTKSCDKMNIFKNVSSGLKSLLTRGKPSEPSSPRSVNKAFQMVTRINQRKNLANRYRMERRIDHLVKQDTFMLPI